MSISLPLSRARSLGPCDSSLRDLDSIETRDAATSRRLVPQVTDDAPRSRSRLRPPTLPRGRRSLPSRRRRRGEVRPRTPAIGVAAGPFVFIYRNLRPYFKVPPARRARWFCCCALCLCFGGRGVSVWFGLVWVGLFFACLVRFCLGGGTLVWGRGDGRDATPVARRSRTADGKSHRGRLRCRRPRRVLTGAVRDAATAPPVHGTAGRDRRDRARDLEGA